MKYQEGKGKKKDFVSITNNFFFLLFNELFELKWKDQKQKITLKVNKIASDQCIRSIITWEDVRKIDLIWLNSDAAVEGILTGGSTDLQVKEHRVKRRAVQTVPEERQQTRWKKTRSRKVPTHITRSFMG